jgi:hypothetical protein
LLIRKDVKKEDVQYVVILLSLAVILIGMVYTIMHAKEWVTREPVKYECRIKGGYTDGSGWICVTKDGKMLSIKKGASATIDANPYINRKVIVWENGRIN